MNTLTDVENGALTQKYPSAPRRQILQLVCTHKGPVTALLGPASSRISPDPQARRTSRHAASTDDHPNVPGLGQEDQLDQIFTGGHDGKIRVWETSRLGVMTRRLVACGSLAQVILLINQNMLPNGKSYNVA